MVVCDITLTPTPTNIQGVLPNYGRTPYFYLIQYNFTQTKRPDVRKNTDFRSFFRTKPQATKKASPWGEVPSLSRRRGVMTIKRKNCSPLSVALTGASSPQGGAFLSIAKSFPSICLSSAISNIIVDN